MFTAEELSGTICAAREYVQHLDEATRTITLPPGKDFESLANDFVVALVQIADRCVVGMPCDRHAGMVHGGEAEELRRGIGKILRDFDLAEDRNPPRVEQAILRELSCLLDKVDARDSAAFLEKVP